MNDLSEIAMLSELVNSEKLSPNQTEAFTGMLADLEGHRISKLSDKQRTWVRAVHVRLGLSPEEAENLVSTGQVKVTETERKELHAFLASFGKKILKPPGK
jgi:hypothetical protein